MMPLVKADQIIELKEKVKQYHQAISRQDFVEIAMVVPDQVRQGGQEHVSRWMKELGCEKMGATLQETVLAGDTRAGDGSIGW
jgi:hypothetical protein